MLSLKTDKIRCDEVATQLYIPVTRPVDKVKTCTVVKIAVNRNI